MPKPIILLDVDGVLADFIGGICRLVNDCQSRGNPKISPSDINQHDFMSVLNREQLSIVETWAHQDGFCSDLDWYPAAKVLVRCLQDVGEVYAVTTPWECPTWYEERVEWLSRYIPKNRVIFTHSKELVRGDVLIEDSAVNLDKWIDSNDGRAAVLFDRPWNQAVTQWPVKRVKTPVECAMYVRSIFP